MQGNKKLLVIAVLLLLLTVTFTTYAIYKSSATGDATINTAAWVISVGDTDIVENNTFTIDDIDWGNNTVGQAGTIAPGDTGTVDIVIDATGSQVAVDYAITIGDLMDNNVSLENDMLTATAATGASLTGTIPYNPTSMTVTIPLDVVWQAVDDDSEDGQNETDIATAAKALKLPVTVTVTQHPGV